MIKKENAIKIGRFAKPHGIKGEITFMFSSDVFDRCGSEYLICDMDGILVPFFMEEYRFKSDTTALIKFENIDTEDAARRFSNLDVYYPKKYISQDDLEETYSWNYFIGFHMEEESVGDLGEIVDVDESTVNVLLQVSNAGKELLIPAVEEFIKEIDHDSKKLYVQLPEGLLNLDNMKEVY